MKRFYSILLMALFLLPFTASAYNIKLDIDNPDAVTVSYKNNNVEVTKGINNLEIEAYNSVSIVAADGYLITRVTTTYDENMPNSGRSYQIWSYGDYDTDKIWKFTTIKESEFRDGTFRLYVDNAANVSAQLGGTYLNLKLVDGWQDVPYSTTIETSLTVSHQNWSSRLYQVKKNGEPQAASGSQFNISLEGSPEIEVLSEFPDEPASIHFVFVPEDCSDFLTSVKVNGVEKTREEFLAADFSVKLGDNLSITGDTNNFRINNGLIKVNGENAYCYGNWEGIITCETTIEFNVTRYETVEKKIFVEGADHIKMYVGSYVNKDEDPIIFQEGENTYSFNTNNIQVAFDLESGYKIESITDNGNDCMQYIGAYSKSIYLESEGDLVIKVVEIVKDMTLVIYVDDIEAGEYFSFQNTLRENVSLATGYNIYKFYDGEVPFMVSWYNTPFNNLYLNGEKQTGMWGSETSYQLSDLASGDVCKLYFTCDPQPVKVTFQNDATVGVEGEVDHITPLASFEEMQVLPGTHIKLSSTGDKSISVKVNGGEATDAKSHEITADSDTHIEIADGNLTGIEGVTVNDSAADADVYNLQGVRVAAKADFETLPAGLYIVGGEKVVKK